MSPMTPDLAFIERMNGVVNEAQHRSTASYHVSLQKQMIDELGSIGAELLPMKRQAVEHGDEPTANLILGYQCVFTCLTHELDMWIQLKAGDADQAWEGLIFAQDAAVSAARAHPGFSHLPHHLLRLEALERLLFPHQVFVSSGFVVGRQVCSLCEAEYDDCDHVAGRPYWGEFCVIRQEELSLDHVAIVEVPASKLCRVIHIGEGADRRNRMSGLPDPATDETFTARLT